MNQPAGENERILRCPDCGEVMLRQEPGFYKCPMCDGEFWPPDELGEEDEHQQVVSCWLEDVRIPLIRKHRSSRSRRKRKKPLPPRRPWQIF